MSARQTIPQTHDPCALCHKPNATKRCGRCRAVVYCSRACQASHWRAHKLTCGAPPPPVPPRPQTPGELAEDCARQLAERGYAALGPLVDLHRRTALRTHARNEIERLLKLPLAAANAREHELRPRRPQKRCRMTKTRRTTGARRVSATHREACLDLNKARLYHPHIACAHTRISPCTRRGCAAGHTCAIASV